MSGKSPLWKRKAKRRRRAALAKHHRKVMKLAARGEKTFPKRPPKPKRIAPWSGITGC